MSKTKQRKRKPPKKTEPLKGIDCPHCRGFRLTLLRSTRPCRGVIRRRRECTACGHRFNTEERVAAPAVPPSVDPPR